MSDASRLLRGTLPCLVAFAVATGFVLPANARQLTGGGQTVPAVDVTRGAEWWLTALQVPAAWRAAPAEGNGVTVAVLSTGVDAASQDLTGAVTIGPDYAGSGRTAAGPFWGYEGTAVASLIAGHGHGAGGTDGHHRGRAARPCPGHPGHAGIQRSTERRLRGHQEAHERHRERDQVRGQPRRRQ